MTQPFWSIARVGIHRTVARDASEAEVPSRRRTSLVLTERDRLPHERKGDQSAHRLYHHFYEDMLM